MNSGLSHFEEARAANCERPKLAKYLRKQGKERTMSSVMETAQTFSAEEHTEVPPELQPYMDELPDCPWQSSTKLEWVRELVEASGDGPYPYPFRTREEWVKNLAALDCFIARDNERAAQYAARLGMR